MAQFGLNSQVDPDGSLTDLPGHIFLKLRDKLNYNPCDMDWRALIRAAEKEYPIKPAHVEMFSNTTNGLAADKTILELSSLGMTVRALIKYLKKINIDTYELGLSPREDIVITKRPPLTLEVYEGGVLSLEMDATGLPFPQYQWFFCKNGQDHFEFLQGRTEKDLRLYNVTSANAGAYSCQIRNCNDPKKTELLDNTLVSVVPNGSLSPPISNSESNWKHLPNGLFPNSSDPFSTGYQQRSTAVGYNLIVSHPRSVTVGMNEPFMLSVKTNGDPPITYQWFRNGHPLHIYTPEIHVDSATPHDFGNYHCVVNNGLKQETSCTACVKATAVGYNLIVSHPRSVTVGMNEPFMLSVKTNGDPPITYQWFRNGHPLHIYTPEIHVDSATPHDFGNYHCVVNNGLKQETSQTACVKENFPLPDRITEIVMISQPKSVTVKFGGCALFSCEAKCCEPLRYQWFKDGVSLAGYTGTECKILNIQDRRVEGMYQCEISVDVPESTIHRRLTSGALLTVEVPLVKDNIEYNPSDKVALLIGNYEYMCEQSLKAPPTDVQVLSESFRSLDFKVVALLNLTKPEIENAVLEFCHLVDKNVYAVFYFCGHGFEEDGRSFMVPTDAPNAYKAEQCVCADMVLENIQKKDTPFICLIMDICRKSLEWNFDINLPFRNRMRSLKIPETIDKRSKGNTVFCYATSVGLNAYEDKTNGLLVKHLSPLLRKHIGIDTLMSELKEEFNSVKKHSEIQIPEFRSNILEPRRSLADRISFKGQTEAFQKRNQQWMKAHEKPEKQDIYFNDVQVTVQLDFQSDFSNVLHVFATVINKGLTNDCKARVCNYPPTISQMGELKGFLTGTNYTTKVSLQDIQKLQSKLVVNVLIQFQVNGSAGYLLKSVDLGYPLVSKLHLWKQSESFTRSSREPVEHGVCLPINRPTCV